MAHQAPLDAPPPPVAPRPPPIPLKAVLIGNASTGKTALRNRFVAGHFSDAYRATIGCDFRQKLVSVNDADECIVNAWDTAGPSLSLLSSRSLSLSPLPRLTLARATGQERFRSLAPAFYRASDACLLVYSLADPSSPSAVAKAVKTWYTDFRDKCPVGTGGAPGTDPADEEEQLRRFCWVCVGTKADEADPAHAAEVSTAVERTLAELLPRRTGRESAADAQRAEQRRRDRKAPTVSVEVLHAPRPGEHAAPPRKIRRARRPPLAQAHPGRASEPAASGAPPGDGASSASAAGSTAGGSSATATPTFELDEPIADLLLATSPPAAPAHFGDAGAPAAVWRGGPYGKEGHVLAGDEGEVDVGEEVDGDEGRKGGYEVGGDEDEDEEDVEEEAGRERSEAERFADEGIRHFKRTSAKTGEGVDEVCVPLSLSLFLSRCTAAGVGGTVDRADLDLSSTRFLARSFAYIARRVLAARVYEGLTDEDEHAGTPYVRNRAGAGGHPVKPEDVIRVNEQDPRSVGQKLRSACCS